MQRKELDLKIKNMVGFYDELWVSNAKDSIEFYYKDYSKKRLISKYFTIPNFQAKQLLKFLQEVL